MKLRSVLLGVLIGLLLAGGAGAAYVFLIKEDVSTDELADSLTGGLSYAAVVSCEEISDRRWRCDVTGGEGPVQYLVSMPRDRNCWDAAYSEPPDANYFDLGDDDPNEKPHGCLD